MTQNVTNELIYETLKSMQTRLGRLEDGQEDIRNDIRAINSHMAGFFQTTHAHESQIASLTTRMDRVERRLDLRD